MIAFAAPALRLAFVSVLAWAGLASAPQALAQGESMPRMVIELFTSQGCSNSPKADAFVAEMAQRADVVAVSYAVDYWDYLGWKDTLATPENAARQKAYAAQRGDHKVYTPQVVIDGKHHVVGSKREKIQSVADSARGQHGALTVPMKAQVRAGKLVIEIGSAGDGPRAAQIVVLAFKPQETVTVSSGENAGKTMHYRNIVRAIRQAGSWDGMEKSVSVDLAGDRAAGIGGYAVLLQVMHGDKPGVILGAAKTEL
ncbi:MAG: DUF1223 domain-containing protein [Beijerinckiaceae bacterium]